MKPPFPSPRCFPECQWHAPKIIWEAALRRAYENRLLLLMWPSGTISDVPCIFSAPTICRHGRSTTTMLPHGKFPACKRRPDRLRRTPSSRSCRKGQAEAIQISKRCAGTNRASRFALWGKFSLSPPFQDVGLIGPGGESQSSFDSMIGYAPCCCPNKYRMVVGSSETRA